jgi:hypothetical protein
LRNVSVTVNVGAVGTRVRAAVTTVRPYVPVTVIAVTVVSGYLAANGIEFGDVFTVTVLILPDRST